MEKAVQLTIVCEAATGTTTSMIDFLQANHTNLYYIFVELEGIALQLLYFSDPVVEAYKKGIIQGQ